MLSWSDRALSFSPERCGCKQAQPIRVQLQRIQVRSYRPVLPVDVLVAVNSFAHGGVLPHRHDGGLRSCTTTASATCRTGTRPKSGSYTARVIENAPRFVRKDLLRWLSLI